MQPVPTTNTTATTIVNHSNLGGNQQHHQHHCIGSTGGAALIGGGMHGRGALQPAPPGATSMAGLGGQNAGLFTFAVAPHPRA
uniref:Uncharacterized protein n=2 Tax=gambiae species complex TaxID=44542 RepID=A0A8W7PMV4_ANOCL